ncbi:MAG TPA: DUF58 domain-containing protein [Actinomycetota bacterium]|nr:DUF58 domain-containing protein [Actinomycetota bacterium]
MRRRLSPRALTIAASGGILFVAGSTAQAGWLFVLAAGVFGLVVGSLFVRQHLSGADVQRTVPGRVRAGDDVRVGIAVTNFSKRRLPLMRVSDSFEAFDPTAVAVERLGPGETVTLEQVRRAERRGVYEGGEVSLRAGAPFGFMSTTRTVDVPTSFVVVPRWVELTSFPILEPSSFPSDVLHERARTGAGEEYMGVRDYRPGDPQRSVHWRSTARAGRLVVREYEEEVASKVVLIIAGGDEGAPPDSSFESLVSAAASIARYALQTGHPIDLVRYDADGNIARVDGPDRFSVLDWLARAVPNNLPLLPLVAPSLARIGRRGTVVIFSGTTGVAGREIQQTVRSIQTAGSRAIVVAAKTTSWAPSSQAISEEESVLSELGRGRASVRVISQGEDLFDCLTSLV